MPESQSNSIQTPVESVDRPPREARRSNALAAFIFAETVPASLIALAAGAAIFQSISNGEVSIIRRPDDDRGRYPYGSQRR